MELGKAFGEVLRSLREEKGLTQAELAERCDNSIVFISMLERGKRQPSLKTAFLLAQAFDLSPSEFIKVIELQHFKNKSQ